MGEEAGTDAFHKIDKDGKDGGDKILTAGPSSWELAQTNLVDELRNLLRARDMALAEQRARHVKESVILREQRHILAKIEPDFAGKFAKLFGWTDTGESPTSMSPLMVSPVRSRSVSPIGSPTSRRKQGDDRLDDRLDDATARTAHADNGVTDVVVGRTELSRRLELIDTPTVGIFGDGAANGEESQTRSTPPSRIADPAVSLIAGSAKKEESATAACTRCTQLHQELETVLTDRALAEAELVSVRRAISQLDTAWECDSSGGADVRCGTEQTFSGKVNSDLALGDELGRLGERLASLGEDGKATSGVDDHGVDDDQNRPDLKEFVLRPEDEVNANKSASLAASLSAVVAGRARYFDELSRRRVLRLSVEADLQAARAKLEILLASEPPASQRSDPAKGDDGHRTRSSEEKERTGGRQPRHGDTNDDATQQKAGGECEGSRKLKGRQDARCRATNVVSKNGVKGSAHQNTAVDAGKEDATSKIEVATDTAKPHGQAEEAGAPHTAEGRENTRMQKKTDRQAKPETKPPRGQVARDPVVFKSAYRSPGKTTKTKPALRATTIPPARLRVTTKAAKRAVAGAAGSNSDVAVPDHASAVGGAEDAQRPEGSKVEIPLGASVIGSDACDGIAVDRAVGDEGAAEGGTARSSVAGKSARHDTNTTQSNRNEVLPRRQVTRDPVVLKLTTRSPGNTTKTKSASRGTTTPSARLGVSTKSTKRALADAAGLNSDRAVPHHAAAVGEAEDARRPEESEVENLLGASVMGSDAYDGIAVDRAVGEEVAAEGGTARSNVDGKNARHDRSTPQVPCLEIHHAPTVTPTPDVEVVGDDCNGSGSSEGERKTPTDACGGRTDVTSEPSGIGNNGDDDRRLPQDAVNLAEALRVDVDRLSLERAELEDTVAQLNVAAAQLYFVEYEQMKIKCRQLKRVILGPSSRPTEQESAYGHSCQEILYRLKVIGVNFFRRRVGGVMGERFFPDGLARTLSLVSRKRAAQECQTTPVERLGPLGRGGASPASPASRDVSVQVAGGIDTEDEPLMEHQVYSLLGKLDLLLKGREDVLRTYHREAEEGARESRALLASAAAQHDPGQAWGVSRPPNIRQLIGGREGPAGAPRPAINPTNLLFTAAVVLDSVVAAAAGPTPKPFDTPKSTAAECAGDHRSRRQRFSPAEKALMELADEIVAALESEQRRSDASAERRRFLVERRNSGRCSFDSHRNGFGPQALGRPPVGVPPLIWAMEIHLVGKLAQAFRIAVEARGFEREVEDANLVAAVSIGRSPPLSTKESGNSEAGHPGHLGHRMLSVLRGEEDEEERRRRQRARGDFEKDQGVGRSGREQASFDWGVETYSPHGTTRRSKGGARGNGVLQANSSQPNSPGRTEGLARGELSGHEPSKGRPSTRGVCHGSTLQPKPAQQFNETGGTRRNGQHQQPQRDLPRHGSAAVARVEAAVFDTVRPSRLHPRPGSASVEGRSGRVGSERITPYAVTTERLRPRPQSARLAEPSDDFAGDRKIPIANFGSAIADQGTRVNMQDRTDRGRRAYQSAVAPEAKMATGRQQQQQPVRPTTAGTASAVIRRPASAGGRVVDTRIWCSNKNVTEPGAGIFRCRPNNTVRFESNEGMSSPTHAGEVPEFLRRKEKDLLEGDRERSAAVNGRFAVVYGDNEEEDISGPERIEYHRAVGYSRDGPRGGRQGAEAIESDGWGVARGSPVLSSVRLEDSMDGEGLLPDAGEQAFFDAWKPMGYDIDLSRYD